MIYRLSFNVQRRSRICFENRNIEIARRFKELSDRDPISMDGMKSIIGQKFRSSLSARLASRVTYSQLPILRVLRHGKS